VAGHNGGHPEAKNPLFHPDSMKREEVVQSIGRRGRKREEGSVEGKRIGTGRGDV
jgi:hypothetical protein